MGSKKNLASGRSYSYDKAYEAAPAQVAARTARNQARRKMTAKVGAAAIAGKDIHHKDGRPTNNSAANLKIETQAKNRGRK